MPRCLIIAGPNGAGKTTFAREFLPHEIGVLHFVNSDLLAAGLAPFDPSSAQVAAGRLFLKEIDRLASTKTDFAFESTLSGTVYRRRINRWRTEGYEIEMVYLKLSDVRIALQRIAARVRLGGHGVPEADVRRRFTRSWDNFGSLYRALADRPWVFDVSGPLPILLEQTP